ncbi:MULTISPECIES: hypothetical protein [Bradyrhizobium]|uniref:DUF3606 domain-containing protein n=1 Tax=Bradyrhizobium agreste TaxID=2751811 RepID=A0ABS0PH27_9BRAD|nr:MULTISPECIES: hypothetical protein [Bradyrhizobium]MBH5372250.1 hypothetical protein [Bradyrhizobium glycinis]MBH5396415.1 hypothetical protein [Bradyrhizobium agreste]
MPIRKKSGSNKRVSAKFVLGRERFAKISAVEGIKPTAAMKKRASDFEVRGLSASERRREIIKAYRKG